MSVKYGKRDANHGEIRDAARRMGATVIDTPDCGQTCPGFPDQVWFVQKVRGIDMSLEYYSEVWFVEVKAGPSEPLTKNEVTMGDIIQGAEGHYHVVRSVDDVERLLRR